MGKEKIQYQRVQIRRRRMLREFLNRYLNMAHKYLDFLEATQTRLTDSDVFRYFRSVDELRQFLKFNAELVIKEDSLFLTDILRQYLDFCIEIYLDNVLYSKMLEGIDPPNKQMASVNGKNGNVSEFTVGFRSLKECMENDESLDFEGRDSLKRLVFKDNLLQDKSFLSQLGEIGHTEKNDVISLAGELYSIIEKEVYPKYHYIDQSDVEYMMIRLASDKYLCSGYFEPKGVTHVFPRVNPYRNFLIFKNT